MLAQRLRHTVTLQQNTGTTNAYGETVAGWVDVATVRAGVEPVAGKEAIAAGANLAEQVTRIVMRWRSGVVAQMRVSFDGRYYDIKQIINKDEGDRTLELLCVEGVNRG